METRSLLLVVPLIALGLGERASAAVIVEGTSAVFAFDLPDVAPEFTVWGSEGVSIGCNADPCGSVLYWPLFPEPGEEDERVAPPTNIRAKAGTGPDLHDLGSFSGNGWDYASMRGSFLESDSDIEIPLSASTLYFTFTLFGDDSNPTTNAFYVVNMAHLDFRWGYGDGEWWDGTSVTGRLYDPFTPVPLPGSLLLILSSIGASLVPAVRRRLLAQA
jgi:hypothetical protein